MSVKLGIQLVAPRDFKALAMARQRPASRKPSFAPSAANLIAAGFFLSAAGRGVEKPNRLILLLYLGAISLAAGVVALGIGLLAG